MNSSYARGEDRRKASRITSNSSGSRRWRTGRGTMMEYVTAAKRFLDLKVKTLHPKTRPD